MNNPELQWQLEDPSALLANPVSNRLYEKLGFVACGDWARLVWADEHEH